MSGGLFNEDNHPDNNCIPVRLLRASLCGDYMRPSVRSVPAKGSPADADWFYLQTTFNV
jgi:hypothetical protein